MLTPRFCSFWRPIEVGLRLSRWACCDWMREFERLHLQGELRVGDQGDLGAGGDAVAFLDG